MTRHSRFAGVGATKRVAIAAATVVLTSCATASSGRIAPVAAEDAAAFIVTLGNDTLSAETFTRTGDRIEGTVVRRSPRTTVLRYTMQLGANGLPTRLEYNTRLPDGSMLPNGARSVVVNFGADSVITEVQRDSLVVRRVAARGAYPEIDGSVSYHAFAIAALRASGRDSAPVVAYVPGASRGEENPVVRRGPNRWWVYSFGSPIEIITDESGRILSVDASRTTFRIQARRQPPMDLSAIAARFLERERAAGPLVALSPRDSLSATIGSARVSIGYGRPSARGRRIWGPNGVLGDTIWRTGANVSTRLYTTAPLMIGNAELAPGNYVVTTLAMPGRYQLILSQGETEVVRVPLSSRTIDPPVEQFTMAIEPTTDRAGVLRLRWDTLELSVPIRERQ